MAGATPTTPVALDAALLDTLAGLLEYPDDGYRPRLVDGAGLLRAHDRAAAHLERLRGDLEEHTFEALQELYTRTFDHNEDCALEVGWHCYGETYQRGVFMTQMRDLLRQVEVPESAELPDHLSHVLKAVARMPATDASRLVRFAVLPALARIEKGLRDKSSPYLSLLHAIHEVLAPDTTGGGRDE